MADRVGKIVFEGEFESGDIADEIRREVVAELLPLLKLIQKEAAKSARALDEIDGEGISNAADEVDDLVKELNKLTGAALGAEKAADRHNKALAKESDLARDLVAREEAHVEQLKAEVAASDAAAEASRKHSAAKGVLTRAIKKYGADSEQAAAAQTKLTASEKAHGAALKFSENQMNATEISYGKLLTLQTRYTDALADAEVQYRATQVANRKMAAEALAAKKAEVDGFTKGEKDKQDALDATAAKLLKQAIAARKSGAAYRTLINDFGAAAAKGAMADSKASPRGGRKGVGVGGLRLGDDESWIGNRFSGGIGSANKAISRFIGKLILLPLALAAALPALGLLVGLVGQLGVSLLALAPAAGAGIAALVIGFKGLSEGSDIYMKKFEEENEARFTRIGELMAPMLDSFQRVTAGVQERFAQQLVPTFENIGGLADKLSPSFLRITDSFAAGTNELTSHLNEIAPQMIAIADSAAVFIDGIGPGITDVVKSVLNMGVVAADVMPAIAKSFGGLFTEIGGALQGAVDDGSVARILDAVSPTIDAFGRLVGTLVTDVIMLADKLGPVFPPLIDAFTEMAHIVLPALVDVGRLYAETLTRLLPLIGEFLASLSPITEAALPKLEILMVAIMEILIQLGPTVTNILVALLPMFASILEAVLAIVTPLAELAKTLTGIPGLVEAVAFAFLGWKVAGLITPMTTGLFNMLGTLQLMPKSIGGIRAALGQAISNNKGTIGALLVGGGAALASSDNTLAQIAGVLTSVGGGALAGSAFGPVGAAVGAGVGAAIAGVSFFLNENAAAAARAADAQAAYAAQLERANAAALATQGANKTLTDALFESGGKFDATAIGALGEELAVLPETLVGKIDPDRVEGVASALQGLKLTNEQMALIVSGNQPVFDAMVANLRSMGTDGSLAAQALIPLREQILGMSGAAGSTNDFLRPLADSLGTDIPNALAQLRTSFEAVPKGVPLEVGDKGVAAVLDMLTKAGVKIDEINGKPIVLDTDDAAYQAVVTAMEQLGVTIATNTMGEVIVTVDQNQLARVGGQLDTFMDKYRNLLITPTFTPGVNSQNTYGPGIPLPSFPGPPRADGGMLPGYSPGVDNMMVPMSGGEGVIIPEAMRALGPDWLYSLNHRYRPSIGRKGYADGGVVGVDDNSEIGVLRQIRDLLAGRGTSGAPLNTIAANTSETTTALSKGGIGKVTGDTWADGSPRDPGYEMMAAAIQSLGGDPLKFLGPHPGLAAAGGGVGGVGGANNAGLAALLNEFAKSGQIGPDLQSLGLTPASPVIGAINSAVTRKKNPLGVSGVGELIDEILLGGGYSGSIDSSNKTLITELDKLRKRQLRDAGASARQAAVGVLPYGASGGGPRVTGAAGLKPETQALVEAIKQSFPQITDIGGVRADPHPDHPSGSAIDIMIPGGDTRGGANPAGKALGDQIYQQLLASGAIDPQGSLWQTDTGGNHFDHIHAKAAENAAAGLGLPGGLMVPGYSGGSNPLGYSGAPVPVYIVAGPGGGLPPGAEPLLDGLANGATEAANNVADAGINAITGAGNRELPDKDAGINQLTKEGNPLAAAAALGFKPGDYSRAGGDPGAIDTMGNEKKFDHTGRTLSDTQGLVDRTETSKAVTLAARHEQLMDVMSQVRDQGTEEFVKPVMQEAISAGISGLKDQVTSSIGASLGQAAGPPIADAVKAAIPPPAPADTSGSAGVMPSVPGIQMAGGGGLSGGIPGRDSVPILGMPGEHMLTTRDVAALGGQAGVYAFRAALHRNGGMRRMATGGGVMSDPMAVGAEFFGVSEVPILGAIVGALVALLLAIIGVEIEQRDTLEEITNEAREFRGDFQRFNVAGQTVTDTAGLSERTGSSKESTTDERVSILKLVISELIKFVLQQIVIPITQAVGNAAIQAGATAASTAINTQAPGAGNIVGALISGGGQAALDVAIQIWDQAVEVLTPFITDIVGELLMDFLPGVMSFLFDGVFLARLFDPITAGFAGLMGIFGAISAGIGGFFPSFDNGGIARGTGFLPKATIEPEEVLSPSATKDHRRLTDWLTSGGLDRAQGGDTKSTVVHAPITVYGSERTGQDVADHLGSLIF